MSLIIEHVFNYHIRNQFCKRECSSTPLFLSRLFLLVAYFHRPHTTDQSVEVDCLHTISLTKTRLLVIKHFYKSYLTNDSFRRRCCSNTPISPEETRTKKWLKLIVHLKKITNKMAIRRMKWSWSNLGIDVIHIVILCDLNGFHDNSIPLFRWLAGIFIELNMRLEIRLEGNTINDTFVLIDRSLHRLSSNSKQDEC